MGRLRWKPAGPRTCSSCCLRLGPLFLFPGLHHFANISHMVRSTIALLLLASALSGQKRPITHEDVWLMKRVGALEVSPDGKWAVTSVVEPSYDAAKTASDLWLVSLDGSAPPRRLTSTLAAESGAVFSPDSKR